MRRDCHSAVMTSVFVSPVINQQHVIATSPWLVAILCSDDDGASVTCVVGVCIMCLCVSDMLQRVICVLCFSCLSTATATTTSRASIITTVMFFNSAVVRRVGMHVSLLTVLL